MKFSRDNILYYRLLGHKEEIIKKIYNLETKKIIPYNPISPEKLINYQNIIDFDISKKDFFKLDISYDFKKKFNLYEIEHPLINKKDNYKILINENCLLIADWIESWLNINSKLKNNIFSKIQINYYQRVSDKDLIMLIIEFNSLSIPEEWNRIEEMFKNHLMHYLNENNINLASIYYKLINNKDNLLQYYNCDIYCKINNLRLKITPKNNIYSNDIQLYKYLRLILSELDIKNIPLITINCQNTFINQIISCFNNTIISISNNNEYKNENIDLNNNTCIANYPNSLSEIFFNINSSILIINFDFFYKLQLINKTIANNLNKIKTIILIITFNIDNELNNNINVINENFNLEKIYLLDPLPFSNLVKTINVYFTKAS